MRRLQIIVKLTQLGEVKSVYKCFSNQNPSIFGLYPIKKFNQLKFLAIRNGKVCFFKKITISFKSTFEQWKKVNIERIEGDFSDWIKDFQIKEDVLQFEADLTFTEEFLPVTLQVPKTFPSGVYKYTVLNLSKNLKVETFEEAIEEVIKACEEKREAVANGLVTPSPETETPLGHEKVPWEEDDFKEIQNRIAHDIGKVAQNKFDGWFAQAGAVGTSSCWIYLFIDPKRLNISDLVADAWVRFFFIIPRELIQKN